MFDGLPKGLPPIRKEYDHEIKLEDQKPKPYAKLQMFSKPEKE